jgi:two-component system alkaline phosphatase synthesis response regulator PhoP
MHDNKPLRILIVDDDRDILELLEYNLVKEGFNVKSIDDSREAIRAAETFEPDLIILDIMMPHPNGIEICRELRSMKRFSDTYIFFLTARFEQYYQEAALDIGGDDYIEKIMGLRSLTFKISTVLKRKLVIRKSSPELNIGNMRIFRRSKTVKIGDREVVLSKPEFELLFFFAQNPRKTISYQNILRNIWGAETYLMDGSIEIYIQNLARKLGRDLIHKSKGGDAYRMDFS